MFTFQKNNAKLLAKKSNLIENEALKNAVLKNEQNELGGFGQFLSFWSFGQFERTIIVIEVAQ
jgi:hypothetical protein